MARGMRRRASSRMSAMLLMTIRGSVLFVDGGLSRLGCIAISVGDLLDLLGASEATIRRDINALAEKGEVKRIRGGAEAVRPRHQPHRVGMPFAMSQDVSVPQKRAIARAAAGLIAPGESIIINGGTTTFALVEFLENSDLDILT